MRVLYVDQFRKYKTRNRTEVAVRGALHIVYHVYDRTEKANKLNSNRYCTVAKLRMHC